MNFLAIYFTGTGNSYRLLKDAKEYLSSLNHNVDEVDVISLDIKDINNYDALIVCYPIYAFNAPKPIIQYVKKLNKANKEIPCLVLKQSGEHLFWNNASSLYLQSLLKRRNIFIKNEYHYLMPYSFIFRHSDYMAYRMDQAVKGLLPLDISDFLNGKENPIKRYFFDRPFAFILRIQWWGGRFNGLFYKVDKKKCSKCMRCVNNCPSKNIVFENDKFKFGYQCLMCQKCVMYCPKKAVKCGMFNSWRVDEPYTFKEASYQKETKPNFCKKNYEKYFKYVEDRLNK